MRIHALSTGSVQITTAMLRGRGRSVPARLARALLDRNYTEPLPIHAWLIEHRDGPLLVDTGELADTRDAPLARFRIGREQEIDRRLAELGLAPQDLAAVVLTHTHGDHRNGLARLPGARVLLAAEALGRGARRHLAAAGARTEVLRMTAGAFGAFAASAPVTGDGAVVAVPVPGHARGQVAVVVVEEDRHVMLGGDSSYSEQQLLDLHPDGVSVSPRAAVTSMRTIIAHARRHPTVYLPSHDPDAAARLSERRVLATP
jgi:glyoxylase-like metal-dependent hydrolase (beta-lactamase superfamily II)